MRFQTLVLGTALVASALTSATPAHADDPLRIMVGGIDKQIYLPAKLAERLGYFKDEGLDVELLTEPSGVSAEDELLAGAVQGVVGFYDHCIDLQSRGQFVESVVQLGQAPGEVELVSSRDRKMRSPADWRGATLGVTGLGSSTNFITEYVARKFGISRNEITTVPVGAGDTFIAAMREGRIDAGMTTEPTVSRLLKSGDARILFDLRTEAATRKVLGGVYPAASFYVQTSWAETHPVLVQKLVNAFVRTLAYIKTHSAAEIASHMPSEYYAGDRALYVKGLADGKAMFTADGRMPPTGPRTVLAVLAAFSRTVMGKSIDLSKTYTNHYVAMDARADRR